MPPVSSSLCASSPPVLAGMPLWQTGTRFRPSMHATERFGRARAQARRAQQTLLHDQPRRTPHPWQPRTSLPSVDDPLPHVPRQRDPLFACLLWRWPASAPAHKHRDPAWPQRAPRQARPSHSKAAGHRIAKPHEVAVGFWYLRRRRRAARRRAPGLGGSGRG
eukprot:3776504-Rhodomonas_salina.2